MTKNSVSQNVLWRLFEKFGAQTITLVSSIILARLLDPETYGLTAIAAIIITIICAIGDCGLTYSLIQKKDADDLDFSSVFYFNIVLSLLLYLLLYLFSSGIANFYNIKELSIIFKIYGVFIITSCFMNIQIVYVSRHIMFKKFFYSSLGSTILSSFIGIWMALNGFGVWSLVCQYVVNNLAGSIILWYIVDWKPKLMFSFSRIKKLFSFGSKMLISSLLDTIWKQLRQLIIGKKYQAEDVAYYDKANHYSQTAMSTITDAFDSVLLPVMSNSQDDISKVKQLTCKSIKVGSFVLWPILIGFAACADSLVKILLTEKWLPIVPYFRIFCISYAFNSIHTPNLNAIKALGKSDIFLKLGVINKVVELLIIIVSIRYGIYAMVLGVLMSNIIAQIINSWPNKKLINYKYIDQLKDIFPILFLSILMGIIVYEINFLGLNMFVTLLVQIISGVVIYIGLSYLFKIDSLFYCVTVIKSILNKTK